jgi:hypothetical protein
MSNRSPHACTSWRRRYSCLESAVLWSADRHSDRGTSRATRLHRVCSPHFGHRAFWALCTLADRYCTLCVWDRRCPAPTLAVHFARTSLRAFAHSGLRGERHVSVMPMTLSSLVPIPRNTAAAGSVAARPVITPRARNAGLSIPSIADWIVQIAGGPGRTTTRSEVESR